MIVLGRSECDLTSCLAPRPPNERSIDRRDHVERSTTYRAIGRRRLTRGSRSSHADRDLGSSQPAFGVQQRRGSVETGSDSTRDESVHGIVLERNHEQPPWPTLDDGEMSAHSLDRQREPDPTTDQIRADPEGGIPNDVVTKVMVQEPTGDGASIAQEETRVGRDLQHRLPRAMQAERNAMGLPERIDDPKIIRLHPGPGLELEPRRTSPRAAGSVEELEARSAGPVDVGLRFRRLPAISSQQGFDQRRRRRIVVPLSRELRSAGSSRDFPGRREQAPADADPTSRGIDEDGLDRRRITALGDSHDDQAGRSAIDRGPDHLDRRLSFAPSIRV